MIIAPDQVRRVLIAMGATPPLVFSVILGERKVAQFLEPFSRNKPGLWGEPAWYLLLTAVGILVVLGLLINAVLIGARAGDEGIYRRQGLIVIALMLTGGLFYSSVTPPWQAPDEHAHYEYAALMGELRRVPTLDDIRQDVQAEVTASMFEFDFWRLIQREPVESPPVGFYRAGDLAEYPATHVIDNQYIYYPQVGDEPPTYYILPALLYGLSTGQSSTYRLYLMRLASVVFWVGTGGAVWCASRWLFPDQRELSLAVLTVVACNPMLSHIGTVLSNDGLTVLWSTLALGAAVLVLRRGLAWQRVLALSSAIVLAVATKKSSLWLVPTLGVFLLLLPEVPSRWRLAVGSSMVGMAVAAFVLFLWPTGAARYWEGGTRIAEVGVPANHVLLLEAGERVSQPIGHQRTSEVRGESLTLLARVRSEGASKINVCLVTRAGIQQCRTASMDQQWRSVETYFSVPEQAEQLTLTLTAGEEAPLDIDALSLAPDAGPDLLRNGSMESGVSWLERSLLVLGHPLGIGDLVTALFSRLAAGATGVTETLPLSSQVLFDSFWGNFGAAMVVPLEPPWPLLTRIATVLAAMGWGINAVSSASGWDGWQKLAFAVLGSGVVFVVAQTFAALLAHSGGWMPQGRFMFPAMWPIAALLVIGWWGWVIRQTKRWFLLCVTLGSVALYVAGTWRLISYFYG